MKATFILSLCLLVSAAGWSAPTNLPVGGTSGVITDTNGLLTGPSTNFFPKNTGSLAQALSLAGIGGVTNFNGLTGKWLTLSLGTTGNDFGILSSGTNTQFSLPIAGTNVTGKMSSNQWSTLDYASRSATNQVVTNTAVQTQLSGKVATTNNGIDFASMATARNNLGSQLIGTSHVEYEWTNVAPISSTHEGRINQGNTTAYYHATGTGAGNWNGNMMVPGVLQIGSQYWQSNYYAPGSALDIWHGGSPDFASTNGAAVLGELSVVCHVLDPRQAFYFNFQGVDTFTSSNNYTLTQPQDFQIGWCPKLYGTNTLGGLGIGKSGLITMNPGTDFHITTGVDKGGTFLARSVLTFDNANQIWSFADDIVGNGSPANPGYKALLQLDTRNHITYIGATNQAQSLGTVPITTFANGGVQIGGNVFSQPGRGNIGSGSFGSLWVNTVGTPNASSLTFGGSIQNAGNPAAWLNFNAAGDLQLGVYNSTLTGFSMIECTNTGASVYIKTNLNVLATASFSAAVVTNKITFNSSTGPFTSSGSGSPNSVVTAPIGSVYYRTDGGAATTLYVKESGTGNTGWVGK
ncbi:MAG: hypothetical protein JWR69_1744 [Pedosphaera sp.]|nr:hypothetical protein [Pedosphaera sp.]